MPRPKLQSSWKAACSQLSAHATRGCWAGVTPWCDARCVRRMPRPSGVLAGAIVPFGLSVLGGRAACQQARRPGHRARAQGAGGGLMGMGSGMPPRLGRARRRAWARSDRCHRSRRPSIDPPSPGAANAACRCPRAAPRRSRLRRMAARLPLPTWAWPRLLPRSPRGCHAGPGGSCMRPMAVSRGEPSDQNAKRRMLAAPNRRQ